MKAGKIARSRQASESDRNDSPPDAGAASGRKAGQPRAKDGRGDRGNGSTGFYVLLSKTRMDYGRPLFQPGANSNSPPRWTQARITGLGEFRALARLVSVPDIRAEQFRRPVRPATAAGAADAVIEGAESDDGLSGLLAAIADEVQARAAGACASLTAEFAGRIDHARMTLPRDQVAAAVAALKQAKKAAVKFVRESAAMEIKGRQKVVRVMWKRGRIRLANDAHKSSNYDWK